MPCHCYALNAWLWQVQNIDDVLVIESQHHFIFWLVPSTRKLQTNWFRDKIFYLGSSDEYVYLRNLSVQVLLNVNIFIGAFWFWDIHKNREGWGSFLSWPLPSPKAYRSYLKLGICAKMENMTKTKKSWTPPIHDQFAVCLPLPPTSLVNEMHPLLQDNPCFQCVKNALKTGFCFPLSSKLASILNKTKQQ